MTETEITAQIRNILSLLKVPHFKHFGGPMAQRGVSDIIGTIPPNGRALFIEVKKPGGAVSPEQQEFLDKHSSAGALAFIARSPQEVVEILSSAGYEPAQRVKEQLPRPIH